MILPLTPLTLGLAPNHAPWREIRDLFYRGSLSKVIEMVEVEIKQSPDFALHGKLVQAACHIERGNIDLATKIILEVKGELEGFSLPSPDALVGDVSFVIAGLQYLQAVILFREGHFDQAMESFMEIHSSLGPREGAIRTELQPLAILARIGCLLGALDLAQEDSIQFWYEELSNLEINLYTDLRIHLHMALARHALLIKKDAKLSQMFAKKAFSEAMSQSWSYFAVSALLLVATVHQIQKEYKELHWTLEFLKPTLESSEYGYLSNLVDLQFKGDLALNAPIEFDAQNKRVFMGGDWLALHERPILFDFLMLLRKNVDFVDKKSIAEALWPTEPYKSRVHDPRIFDIAKRTRNMIEAHHQRPSNLLSGRLGYKLADL